MVTRVCTTATAQVPFDITGPGVDASDIQMTEFASGLNYSVGMIEMSDGSLLVGISNGASFFGSNSGLLVRLADTDSNGVADQKATLVNDVPGGKLSAVRSAGDLVFVTGQGQSVPIVIYRMGTIPADPLTKVGTLDLNYPLDYWFHPHSALGARETPGQPGSYDLIFQLGSKTNASATTANVGLTSDIGVSGSLAGDALHIITIIDDGNGEITGSNLYRIATGLRNAAGVAFHPTTGSLYLQDNGIDGFSNPNELESADELNIIAATDLTTTIVDLWVSEKLHSVPYRNVCGGW